MVVVVKVVVVEGKMSQVASLKVTQQVDQPQDQMDGHEFNIDT